MLFSDEKDMEAVAPDNRTYAFASNGTQPEGNVLWLTISKKNQQPQNE